MVVDRQKQKLDTSSAILGVAGPLPNAANSSDVPQQNTVTKMKSKVKFRNLNFSPSTKNTVKYSVEFSVHPHFQV